MTAIKSSKVAEKLRMVSFLALALTGVLFMGLNANTASAQTIGFLEGGIEVIAINPDGSGTVKINGVTAKVLWDTPITSATGTSLTLDQISKGTNSGDPDAPIWSGALPGRPTGFEGGTCLCTTKEVILLDGSTEIQITDFFAEPSENGVLATVTDHSCTTPDCSFAGTASLGFSDADVFNVGGTPMAINTDDRIHSPAPINSGFDVNLQNVTGGVEDTALSLVGQLADAVGYFADGKLYYYALEVNGAPPLSTNVQIAITRARCRDNDGQGTAQYRVEGTTQNPNGPSGPTQHEGPVDVEMIQTDGTTFTSMTSSVQDPLDQAATFATWAVRETISGTCQDGKAVFTPAGGMESVTFSPDIK